MKKYRICEPKNPSQDDWTPVSFTVTEEQILERYWHHWVSRVRDSNNPACQKIRQMCIDDWVTVHWAVSDAEDPA